MTYNPQLPNIYFFYLVAGILYFSKCVISTDYVQYSKGVSSPKSRLVYSHQRPGAGRGPGVSFGCAQVNPLGGHARVPRWALP